MNDYQRELLQTFYDAYMESSSGWHQIVDDERSEDETRRECEYLAHKGLLAKSGGLYQLTPDGRDVVEGWGDGAG